MSRIGNKPIPVPAGVDVAIDETTVRVKGPKGELVRTLHKDMIIRREGDEVRVERPSDEAEHRALHGLSRTLIANMVEGVTNGYKKVLEIVGVGYRAENKPFGLTLNLGYSHPIDYKAPEGSSSTPPLRRWSR
jgi:large subunit ribosomal protein L6